MLYKSSQEELELEESEENLLKKYFIEGDLQSLKLKLDAHPDLFRTTNNSPTKKAFKSFFISFMRSNNHPDLKTVSDSGVKSLDIKTLSMKRLEIILYIVKRQDLDLFDQDIFGEYPKPINSFHYLQDCLEQLEQFEQEIFSTSQVKEILLAMIERKDFKDQSAQFPFQKFPKNEKYVEDSSSNKIFNVNYQDKHGKTFAHYLFPYYKFDEILSFLKRKDVDLSVLDNDGNTAFSSEILSNNNALDHITMCRRFSHLEKVIDLLKKSNIDFSIGNSNFRTVSTALLNNMHLYRQNIPTYMVVRNKILHPIVNLLRNNENKITIKIVENLLENTNFLKCLEDLQHIPKPQLVDLINSQDCEGNTLLHLAAEYGMFKEVRFLLEKGAKTDILNIDGYTALHLAAFNGELEQYRNLIPLDDDSPNPFLKKSNFNETPEDIQKNTLENSERQTVRTYEKMDQRTTKVLMRLCNKHLKKNREELKEKKDSDLIDRSKQRKTSAPEPKSPKWRKSYFAKYIMSIKTKFLKLSADLKNLLPTSRTTSIFDVTDSKSSKELPEITTILNIVNSKGNTILHGLLKENEDFIRGLHKNIADPIEREAQIKRKHAELAVIIQEFVQFGFDATKKNSDGDTALHLAARTGDTSLFAAFALVKEKNDVSQPNKGLGKESAPGVTLNGEIFLIPNEAGKTPLDIISSASADELEERINQYNDDIKVREAGLEPTKTPSILQINGDLKSKRDNDLTI